MDSARPPAITCAARVTGLLSRAVLHDAKRRRRRRACVCARARENVCAPDESVAGCRLAAALVRFDCKTPPPSSTLTVLLSLSGVTGLDDVRDFCVCARARLCGGVRRCRCNKWLFGQIMMWSVCLFYSRAVFLKDTTVLCTWFESSLDWSSVMSNSQGWGLCLSMS